MAGKSRETTTKFKVDISELKSGISEANRLIRLAKSEFNAASDGMENWSESADGIQAKLEQLNKVLDQEKKKLDLLKEAHARVVEEEGENSKAAQDLQIRINNQQAAVVKTEKSIKDYSAQLDKLEQESKTTKTETEKLTDTITGQSAVLEDLKKKYTDVAIEQGKNSKEARDLAKEIGELSSELKENQDKLEDTKRTADQFDQSLDNVNDSSVELSNGGFTVLKGALANLVADGFQRAISAAKDFVESAVETGMIFDSSMSQVGAVSGAAGKDLEKLRDKAREMGENTKFSASEAADAFNYMAMAGWKTEDMIDGIEGILSLAAASNTDLATTSDIVTDALTAMGYAAKDSGKLADVMAAASSNANTNVELMGETFQYVAPVAGALGFSMEDVASAIGLMANSGIKGSQAGTALRSVFSRLAAPPKEAATAMEILGISLTETDGTMKSLSEVMDDMRVAFDGLSEAEAAQYAKQLAGQEAMSGLLAIVNAAPEDYEKLSRAIYNSEDAAANMAATMQDNLGGDLTSFGSLIESVKITLYEGLEPVLRETIEEIKSFVKSIDWQAAAEKAGEAIGVIRNVLKWIADHGTEIMAVITGIVTGLVAFKAAMAIGKLVSAFSAFFSALSTGQGIITAVKAGMAALNIVLNANPVGIIIGLIATLTAAFIYLWNNCEGFREFWINLWEKIREAAGAAADWLAGVWESVKTFFTETIPTAFHDFIDSVKDFVSGIITWFKELPGKIYDVIVEIFAHLLAWGIELVRFVKEDIPKFIAGVIEWFKQLPGKVWDWLVETATKIFLWGLHIIETGRQKSQEVGMRR